jgi:hypothetical protein
MWDIIMGLTLTKGRILEMRNAYGKLRRNIFRNSIPARDLDGSIKADLGHLDCKK